MKGDFTRDSFAPANGYTRVLVQQGRVQLDADWNEQISILWDYWRSTLVDLIGPFAGPHAHCGFRIVTAADLAKKLASPEDERERCELLEKLQGGGDFLIGPGHYYVAGFQCRNETGHVTYTGQPFLPHAAPMKSNGRPNLVYLDVSERHITHLQDPAIAEVALGGADTTTRAKLIWQVRTLELPEHIHTCKELKEYWPDLVYQFRSRHRAYLRAMAKMPADQESPEASLCGPEASYRGAENRLYRVEIHSPGYIGDQPTFKWSRDNGTVALPIASVDGNTVTLSESARDHRVDIAPGDWVEIVDDDYELWNRAEPLLRVEEVDAAGMVVILQMAPASDVGKNPAAHPVLRRWDQKSGDSKRGGLTLRDGAALIVEGTAEYGWVTLEDGVQIQFQKTDPPSHFATGDYWLIPARTATGDVIWPQHKDRPMAVRPRGPEHHFAPLALLEFDRDGQLKAIGDCRSRIKPDVESEPGPPQGKKA
jgi:hypothetical protein